MADSTFSHKAAQGIGAKGARKAERKEWEQNEGEKKGGKERHEQRNQGKGRNKEVVQ